MDPRIVGFRFNKDPNKVTLFQKPPYAPLFVWDTSLPYHLAFAGAAQLGHDVKPWPPKNPEAEYPKP